MSSKIGLILSLIFVAFFTLLACDMMSIQYIYGDLDAKSTSIAYLISKNKLVDDSLIETIEERYSVMFTCTSNCNNIQSGDVVTFQISKTYKPIIISKQTLTICVNREAIISYYG